MKNGLFISFEGPDGSGKSSTMAFIGHLLQEKGYSVVLTKEPGGDEIGQQIRQILLNPMNREIHPITEAFLYAADRAQHVQKIILPALQAGQIVLCDRYVDSQIAYQGYGRGFLSKDFLYDLNHMASGGLLPDLTLLLLVKPEIGLMRSKIRDHGQSDRMEQEAFAFHQKTCQGYLDLAKEHPQRIFTVDAEKPQAEVVEICWQKISSFLKEQGK